MSISNFVVPNVESRSPNYIPPYSLNPNTIRLFELHLIGTTDTFDDDSAACQKRSDILGAVEDYCMDFILDQLRTHIRLTHPSITNELINYLLGDISVLLTRIKMGVLRRFTSSAQALITTDNTQALTTTDSRDPEMTQALGDIELCINSLIDTLNKTIQFNTRH